MLFKQRNELFIEEPVLHMSLIARKNEPISNDRERGHRGGRLGPMAYYVVIVDLEENGSPDRYLALNLLMCDFGFMPRGPETLRPAQFSITSTLPPGWAEAHGGGSDQSRAAPCHRGCLRD